MSLGNMIDGRQMDIELEDGELIGDVIIIAEVLDQEGDSHLVVVSDENMNWLKEDGMIGRALDKIRYDSSTESR